jgi:N-acetylmuramoyl-L-alanine amidase
MRMHAERKVFHNRFAPASPVFAAWLFGCALLSLFPTFSTEAAESSSTATTSVKKQAASAQFARAEDQRSALSEEVAGKRTLAEYKQVVSTYRRVYLITPHAAEVPEAILAVAELYTEMGDRFGRSYYQSAVESYRFLLHDYPASRHCQDALMRVAQLEKDQLGDLGASAKAYDEFIKKYPHSTRRREAQEAREELALLQKGEGSGARSASSTPAAPPAAANAPVPTATAVPPLATSSGSASTLPRRGAACCAPPGSGPETAAAVREARENAAPPAAAASSSGIAHVERISTSASAGSTRVAIDLENEVEYSSARIHNPDRIFFDLHTAKVSPDVVKKGVHADGGLLTAVRVGQFRAGIVRVVLDVTGVRDYTAAMSGNPPQLVIDLYPESRSRTAIVKAAPMPSADPAKVEVAAAAGSARPVAAPAVEKAAVAKVSQPDPRATSAQPSSAATVAPNGSSAPDGPTTAKVLPSPVATLPSANAKSKGLKAGSNSATTTKPDLVQPATTAQPTRDGQATLTRALGLKIGRIVIDAGHGGHDTGTIGPTGLMEKDLCLDIALRLGKIVQQRLPGADVVYTRSDDTFIPLEERTRIANEAKADLFISIHANSSHDHGARGIETYYLNLKGSPDAMEVAARENATAQESVHDLEDLVKKIARSEKIDESKEFAEDIQESLAKRIQKNYKPVKDRGVRKAPFVVLIGADMPSILTEISFLSNPADEQLLKKPEHRQRVAEGLYQGVASYLQSLNSVTVNMPKLPLKPASHSVASAAVEQTRDPQ